MIHNYIIVGYWIFVANIHKLSLLKRKNIFCILTQACFRHISDKGPLI